jgi:late competence protein required for DNA uptake (superfamily II DNA/RNA helicase)
MELSEEKERVSSEILEWSFGQEGFLNMVSIPYSSPEIFIKVMLNYVNRGKKVVYITNEEYENIRIFETIKKYTDFRDYTYIRNNSTNTSSRLKVCNFNIAINLNEKFDLAIYDDIMSFPTYSNYEVLDLISKVSCVGTKVIVHSIESMLKNKREIVLPIKYNRSPVVEPRSIITRVDIDKDIPFVVYDYLKWSIISDRKVIIYVPNQRKIDKVYSYINNYCSEFSKSIICYEKCKKDKKQVINFKKMKRAVLITDNFEEAFSDMKAVDVMVYFANYPEYDYKKLIYFCANVGRSEKGNKGEVIFLANEETDDMEKAKDIMRNFNREAWEKGLLKI